MRVCNLQKECNIYECSDRIFMCTKTIEEMRERDTERQRYAKVKQKMSKNVSERRNRRNRISKPLHFRSRQSKSATRKAHGRKYDFD